MDERFQCFIKVENPNILNEKRVLELTEIMCKNDTDFFESYKDSFDYFLKEKKKKLKSNYWETPTSEFKKEFILIERKKIKTEYTKVNKLFKKYTKEFGLQQHTVLGFHNQWLFGYSACATACQIMNYVKGSLNKQITDEDYNKKEIPFYNQYYEEFRGRGVEDKCKHLIDFTSSLINILTHPIVVETGNVTFQKSFYLNDDENWFFTDYSCGDNNRGVLIVDTIKQKYCFVNFQRKGLPQYVPLKASEYILESYKDEKSIETVEFYSKDFDLLTLDELKEMFPDTYKNLKPEEIRFVEIDDEKEDKF